MDTTDTLYYQYYQSIQTDLLKALRGRLSQSHFSKKLGFHSNKIHRWETGQTVLSWSDFCDLCHALKLPLVEACRISFCYDGPVTDTKALLALLLGERKLSELAEQMKVSRSLISRWRSGKVEPSFIQMIQIIHMGFSSLPEFIARLMPIEKAPSLLAELAREREEKELHYRYPWIAALLLLIRTVEYDRLPAHQEGFLSKKLGITLEEERRLVEKLLSIGAIHKEKGREIYEPSARSLNVSGDEEGNRRIREYWTDRCLKTIKKGLPTRDRNSWGYMVLNTSPKTYGQIRERYIAFYQDIHNIIQSSTEPSEDVYLLNIQLLNVADLER